MNRKKTWGLAVLLVLLALGTLRCLAYIGATRALYAHAAPCTKLHGVAGVLQATGFIVSGSCAVNVSKGGCSSSGASCTVTNPASGGATKGTCTPTADKQSCVCVVN